MCPSSSLPAHIGMILCPNGCHNLLLGTFRYLFVPIKKLSGTISCNFVPDSLIWSPIHTSKIYFLLEACSLSIFEITGSTKNKLLIYIIFITQMKYKYKENIHKFSFYNSHFMRTILWKNCYLCSSN